MSKVERITRELSNCFRIFHKNSRVPYENTRQQVWNKFRQYFISAMAMKVNARGWFDSQTIILLRKRLDNLNPAKRVKM